MFYISIHDIVSIELDQVCYLENSKIYARTLIIKGHDTDGHPLSQRISLFAKKGDNLTLNQEKQQLLQRLDALVEEIQEGL